MSVIRRDRDRPGHSPIRAACGGECPAESIAQRPGSYQAAYRREPAMFYATGDRDVKRSLDLARQDLEIRLDIHGYDTLAWALHKNKRFDQAAEAMIKALALGTQDATLFAHAGLIEYRRGHSSQAIASLHSANALATCSTSRPGVCLLICRADHRLGSGQGSLITATHAARWPRAARRMSETSPCRPAPRARIRGWPSESSRPDRSGIVP